MGPVAFQSLHRSPWSVLSTLLLSPGFLAQAQGCRGGCWAIGNIRSKPCPGRGLCCVDWFAEWACRRRGTGLRRGVGSWRVLWVDAVPECPALWWACPSIYSSLQLDRCPLGRSHDGTVWEGSGLVGAAVPWAHSSFLLSSSHGRSVSESQKYAGPEHSHSCAISGDCRAPLHRPGGRGLG